MPHIRLTAAAAAAAALVLALALSPATARPCDHGDAGCVVSAQTEPTKLDNFMKTWKPVAKPNPVATSNKSKKSKSARKPAAKEVASKPTAAKEAVSEPAVAETTPPPPPAPVKTLAANPGRSVETDAIGIKSFNVVKDIDAAASTETSKVQVVGFNEVNEIDLSAPPPPIPAESVGQSVSAKQPDADNSWMGKLLLAAAGTIALAGATRFLVA